MCLKCWNEALKRVGSEDGRDGNLLTLDDGYTIFADPNWNEYALACAIKRHKHKEKVNGKNIL